MIGASGPELTILAVGICWAESQSLLICCVRYLSSRVDHNREDLFPIASYRRERRRGTGYQMLINARSGVLHTLFGCTGMR